MSAQIGVLLTGIIISVTLDELMNESGAESFTRKEVADMHRKAIAKAIEDVEKKEKEAKRQES